MKKHELIIYEGAMCCPTGLCGPEPDQRLVEFNETLRKLQADYSETLNITRASLTYNGLLFFSNPEVARLFKEQGQKILPITTVDGKIIGRERYLKYTEIKETLKETENE